MIPKSLRRLEIEFQELLDDLGKNTRDYGTMEIRLLLFISHCVFYIAEFVTVHWIKK